MINRAALFVILALWLANGREISANGDDSMECLGENSTSLVIDALAEARLPELVCPPQTVDATCCSAWRAEVDYLSWRPRQRGLDFATTEDQTAITVGVGRIENLEWDRDSGVRIGLAHRTKAGWDIAFRYTDLETQGNLELESVPGSLAIFATRGHPDSQFEEAATASATGLFDYQVFDAEAGRTLLDGRFATLSVFGGVRWMNTDEVTEFRYDGLDFTDALHVDDMNVNMFGLRTGATVNWNWAHGFGLFGRFAATVGWGEFHVQRSQTNLGGAQNLVQFTDTYSQATPGLEAALGLSYNRTTCLGDMQIASGYEMTSWFNLANRSQFTDDFQEHVYAANSHDVLLEGFFLRLSVAR